MVKTGAEIASTICIACLLSTSKRTDRRDNWLNHGLSISLRPPWTNSGSAFGPHHIAACFASAMRDHARAAALILFPYPFSRLTPSPSNGGSVSERMNQNFNEVKHAAKAGILRILTPPGDILPI